MKSITADGLRNYLGKSRIVCLCILGVVVTDSALPSTESQFESPPPNTLVNDVTGLNPIRVARVVTPRSVEEVAAAIRSSSGAISIGGGRYSQGGQIAFENSLHLDMREMDKVLSLDTEQRHITVQAGITWREIQAFIDPHNLAVKIMQTYANFTVGGSLSVNVHGRYIGEGPLVHSVESIKMVLADGSEIRASPFQNSDIFYGAIGGYGGLGVIVEATLELEPNERIERRVTPMAASEYLDHFYAGVRDNPDIVFHNATIYPPAYTQVRDISWYRTDKEVTVEGRLMPPDAEYFWSPMLANFVADYDFGKWLRQYLLESIYYMGDRVVWRNYEASYDLAMLEPTSRAQRTDVLREYFVPVARFEEFVERMKAVFRAHDVNVINVSIRHAHPDPGTLLAWAREEVFAFVVYYRQGTDSEAKDRVEVWSRAMIDAVLASGGTYYLPYQVLATPEQFQKAYPRHREFFELKRRLDPRNRFKNKLWARHYPENWDSQPPAMRESPNGGEPK